MTRLPSCPDAPETMILSCANATGHEQQQQPNEEVLHCLILATQLALALRAAPARQRIERLGLGRRQRPARAAVELAERNGVVAHANHAAHREPYGREHRPQVAMARLAQRHVMPRIAAACCAALRPSRPSPCPVSSSMPLSSCRSCASEGSPSNRTAYSRSTTALGCMSRLASSPSVVSTDRPEVLRSSGLTSIQRPCRGRGKLERRLLLVAAARRAGLVVREKVCWSGARAWPPSSESACRRSRRARAPAAARRPWRRDRRR